MEGQIFRIVLSHLVTYANLALLIYAFLLKDKQNLLRINNVSSGLMILVYLLNGCYTSALANLFSVGRNRYCEKHEKKSKAVIAAILLSGTALTLAFNLRQGAEELAIIPVISFLLYSIGIFAAKNARQMKLVTALDVLLWITYDFKNRLIVCVFQDVFIVLMTCASYYAKNLEQEKETV